MERHWLKLTPGDDLPLRLGSRITLRPEEIRPEDDSWIKPIPYQGPARWVPARWVPSAEGGDDAVRLSDLAHESAPRPIYTELAKKTTDAQIAKKAELMYEEMIGIPKVKTITRAEADRATGRFVNLPCDEQDALLKLHPTAHRSPGEQYDYKSKCICGECAIIRGLVQREREGEFGETKRGVTALRDFQARVMESVAAKGRVVLGVDLGRPGADVTAVSIRYQDRVEVFTAPTDDEARDYYKRAARSRISAAERELFEKRLALRNERL